MNESFSGWTIGKKLTSGFLVLAAVGGVIGLIGS